MPSPIFYTMLKTIRAVPCVDGLSGVNEFLDPELADVNFKARWFLWSTIIPNVSFESRVKKPVDVEVVR
jgi:hypothetical protein